MTSQFTSLVGPCCSLLCLRREKGERNTHTGGVLRVVFTLAKDSSITMPLRIPRFSHSTQLKDMEAHSPWQGCVCLHSFEHVPYTGAQSLPESQHLERRVGGNCRRQGSHSLNTYRANWLNAIKPGN
jgi:hypothetical protein